MTITDAKAYFGLIAGVTPAGTNLANTVNVGEALTTTSWTDADIAYSFKVAGNAGGDVATLTVSSGAVAQTTGTPTITDAGEDLEGNALSTLVTLYGVAVLCTTTDSTSVTVGGTNGLGGILQTATDSCQETFSAGTTALGTVTLTFGSGDGVAEVVVIGKSS